MTCVVSQALWSTCGDVIFLLSFHTDRYCQLLYDNSLGIVLMLTITMATHIDSLNIDYSVKRN